MIGGMTGNERNARLASYCDTAARWLVTAFCTSFLLLIAAAFVMAKLSADWGTITAILPSVVLFVSGLSYPLVIIIRDLALSDRIPWQFSLRALLIATTLIAVVLGIIVWMSRAG
jgi:hypothetical protein